MDRDFNNIVIVTRHPFIVDKLQDQAK
uniref:Uncharacterized protein n=1 Tax=Rhizophora mucronata TaxID=61149 RepID=A0A2P2PUS2_RHIMU